MIPYGTRKPPPSASSLLDGSLGIIPLVVCEGVVTGGATVGWNLKLIAWIKSAPVEH